MVGSGGRLRSASRDIRTSMQREMPEHLHPNATSSPVAGDLWVVLRAPNDVLVFEVADGLGVVSEHGVVPDGAHIRVGEYAGRTLWATRVDADEDLAVRGAQFVHARQIIGALDPDQFSAFARARMLVEWHHTHRFCGACGAPTVIADGEYASVCAACDLRSYPRISPVVIVAVTRNNQILLAQPIRAGRPMYTVLAGFVEVGESLEQTVAREIAEEVGLTVTDLAYAGSQPWPFPHALMVGFTAQYASGEIVCDTTELVEAGWYSADALPELPPHGSISRTLIDAFVATHAAR